MQLLYIDSDFDENELKTRVYESVEFFVEDRIGIGYTLSELRELAQEPDENPDEAFVLDLLLSGSHEGEWSTEEVWVIKDGELIQGLE